MIDHRRTPSRRAYSLPGWFFLLTATLCIVAFGLAGWIFAADPFGGANPAGVHRPPVPVPTASHPTPKPSPSKTVDEARSGIHVLVLNATKTAGLAAAVAKTAKDAGWQVSKIGNWPYPAAQNAVFYPPGHQAEAELLGKDLSIGSVRPNRPGMSADQLTVILLTTP